MDDSVSSMGSFILGITSSGQLILLEPVPFRFTPALQLFIGPLNIDAFIINAIFSSASVLLKPNSEWRDALYLFLREEIFRWIIDYFIPNRSIHFENKYETERFLADETYCKVSQNFELCYKRTQTLACLKEKEHTLNPNVRNNHIISQIITQPIIDLLSCSINPQKLAQMDGMWHPWF